MGAGPGAQTGITGMALVDHDNALSLIGRCGGGVQTGKAPADDSTGMGEQLVSSLKAFSGRFFEIRHRNDASVNSFLSPAQANILSQNIQSEILMAKFAVFHSNDQSYTNSLTQALRLIEQYYTHDTELYKSTVPLLTELKGRRVSVDTPATLNSYALFKDYGDRHLQRMQLPEGPASESR